VPVCRPRLRDSSDVRVARIAASGDWDRGTTCPVRGKAPTLRRGSFVSTFRFFRFELELLRLYRRLPYPEPRVTTGRLERGLWHTPRPCGDVR
jgi:hypothetical protein